MFPLEATIGIKSLDKAMMLDIVWYESQLVLLGRGKAPNLRLSPWKVIGKMLLKTGKQSFRKRRT